MIETLLILAQLRGRSTRLFIPACDESNAPCECPLPGMHYARPRPVLEITDGRRPNRSRLSLIDPERRCGQQLSGAQKSLNFQLTINRDAL